MLTQTQQNQIIDHLKKNPNPVLTGPFTDAKGVIDWAKLIAFFLQVLALFGGLVPPIPVPTPTPTPTPAP
jgi:hypothetical protein